MADEAPRDTSLAQGRPEGPEMNEDKVDEQRVTPEETSEPRVEAEAEEQRPRSLIAKIFNFGRTEGVPKEEADTEVKEETVVVPLFGAGLTKEEVLDLNDELKDLLTDMGLDGDRYFNRSLDDYRTPADFYEDLSKRLENDGHDVDISETLSTRLGDDHPLVVELRRREALEDVRKLDELLGNGIGEENAAKVFVKHPEDYRSPLEYYQNLQTLAKKRGLDLVPLMTRILGPDHPLPRALGGEVPKEAIGWQSIKRATFKVPEPIQEEEDVYEPGFGCMACIVYWFGTK